MFSKKLNDGDTLPSSNAELTIDRRSLCKRLLEISAIAAGVKGPIEATAHADSLPPQRVSIDQMRQGIARINAVRKPDQTPSWNISKIAQDLTRDCNSIDARRTLFNFVQSFPYRLRHWEDRHGAELYDEESGDCRHKREALYALYQRKGFRVRKVAVFFDLADLPIPNEILAIRKKSGTKGFHSSMDVEINGHFVNVDPTWDPPLAYVNSQNQDARVCIPKATKKFPVTTNWDGLQATGEVTHGHVVRHPHDSYGKIGDLYAAHNIPWPDVEEVSKFNAAFNRWISGIR